jgi:tRNA(Ile)-lysidine synthase
VSRALPKRGSAVLAVSGGIDSMTLLDAAAAVRKEKECAIVVATFDHGSGAHSERAASFVANAALDHGIAVVVGHAMDGKGEIEHSESAWRAARWEFLRSVAAATHGRIITAHTRDDQVETVLMRALRGAGARGLAGLRAATDVGRPFVDVSRAELERYAKSRGVRWLEDPTNGQRQYLRNRVRRDLLPSLLRARPTIDAELVEIGQRAAAWRGEMAALVDTHLRFDVTIDSDGAKGLDVVAADLCAHSDDALAIIWPELASRVGVMLDHRGTRRAANFTRSGRVGGRIQLSGGWELTRSRTRFELHSMTKGDERREAVQFLQSPMVWDRWAFTFIELDAAIDPWRATLPCDGALWVRAWRPGDRLMIRQGDRLIRRKVRYFLSDAGISGHIRERWPVVLAGNEIVWIPGVRRSDAAAARSGRPVVTYACDYLDRRS